MSCYEQLVSIGYHPHCDKEGMWWIGAKAEYDLLMEQQRIYQGAIVNDAVRNAITILKEELGYE